jgi:putative aminopeptidase FrvX
MDKIAEDFLFKYLNNAAPTGFETSGQKLWLDYVKPYTDEFIQDNYGTVAAIINKDAPYKVVIEAHADEISWFVNYISDDGYIYVIRNGGSDHQIAPSKRVNIHTDKGIVKGIFGWPAIHVRNKENDIKPELKNIFIDVGADNKEEVEKMGIHVGCVITFDDEVMYLKDKDYIVGRALDNRIGGFMIAEVARKIHENKEKIPFALYIVNAVQEEVGLKGAQMIAHQIKPDVAVITDVCHDTHSPLYNKIESGDQKSGKGPVLTYGPAVQNNLLKMLIELAENGNISYQRSASSRATGTDTDAFAYSNEGVPSALVSLPLKYMHTTVEMVHSKDVQSVIDLLHSFIINLKEKHNFKYNLS